jgi:hypothetical protein
MTEVLKHEPVSWVGVRQGGSGDAWDMTQAPLWSYRGVATGNDYLHRLETLIGIPEADTTAILVGPLTLVEELDHFALAWRLLTKERILHLPRAGLTAQLTQPVASEAEFKERCGALADIISCFQLPRGNLPREKSKSLHRLEAQLDEHLGSEAGQSKTAVSTLRRIVRVRNGQQHAAAMVDADKDWVKLGLARFGSDWTGAWERVQVVAIEALRTIRESVMRTLEQDEAARR